MGPLTMPFPDISAAMQLLSGARKVSPLVRQSSSVVSDDATFSR